MNNATDNSVRKGYVQFTLRDLFVDTLLIGAIVSILRLIPHPFIGWNLFFVILYVSAIPIGRLLSRKAAGRIGTACGVVLGVIGPVLNLVGVPRIDHARAIQMILLIALIGAIVYRCLFLFVHYIQHMRDCSRTND